MAEITRVRGMENRRRNEEMVLEAIMQGKVLRVLFDPTREARDFVSRQILQGRMSVGTECHHRVLRWTQGEGDMTLPMAVDVQVNVIVVRVGMCDLFVDALTAYSNIVFLVDHVPERLRGS